MTDELRVWSLFTVAFFLKRVLALRFDRQFVARTDFIKDRSKFLGSYITVPILLLRLALNYE
ncbi:hypothetical protein [Microcoleus sp. BROC3]|uniref:hypothetical protein n=1 Tax=Microcoleus sp. BROC3 TaxID=3055323 RepID=UPI002FCFE0D0